MLCNHNGLLGFVCRCRISRHARVFEFIPPTPQVREWAEALAELSPDRALHSVMAAVSGCTHGLLCEQGIAGEPGGVIRQNISTVRISLNQTVRSGYGLSCMY